ncbi:MAG: RNA polymerase sigma-70 factor (ECF subfamily) [Verrucomicrobiales bacterium]|jgi:RNA polymerase sigma-70 factor (ECF subfamily)
MSNMSNLQSDLELLKGVANGDRQCFDLFVKRMERLVYGTVYRVLNDPQDTEDVCQDVFLQVWQKANLFNEGRGKPTTWVATMARNRAIDKIRHKQRRSRLLTSFSEKMTPQESDDVDAADFLDAKECGAKVRSAVMELSTDQRQAIEMAYFNGLTQGEIAGKLNQPLGTVKARIRRSLLKLREQVIPALSVEVG